MTSRVLTAHVPVELADRVDEAAARLDRPRAWIVKQALGDWLALEERRHALTLEGLADIKAGRTVSHEDMQAWVDSLLSDKPKPRPR